MDCVLPWGGDVHIDGCEAFPGILASGEGVYSDDTEASYVCYREVKVCTSMTEKIICSFLNFTHIISLPRSALRVESPECLQSLFCMIFSHLYSYSFWCLRSQNPKYTFVTVLMPIFSCFHQVIILSFESLPWLHWKVSKYLPYHRSTMIPFLKKNPKVSVMVRGLQRGKSAVRDRRREQLRKRDTIEIQMLVGTRFSGRELWQRSK